MIFGGILNVSAAPWAWTTMVYDPDNRPEDYWPDDLFDDGVNVSVTAKRSFKAAGRGTVVALNGIYSTADGADLSEVLLPPEFRFGSNDDSWHASVQVSHFLREEEGRPGRGLNLSFKAGMSDGNPNPFQSFLTGGIAGNGLFASRPDDGFGVGYFYYNFSDDLQSAVAPLLRFDNEQGLEVFYRWQATPWMHFTGDLQYVDPARGAAEKALTAGLRAHVRL